MAKTKAKTDTKAGPLVAGDIQNAPYNPRNISPEQLETLGTTMQEYGDISGIVLNTRTGNCVGGHQRLKHIDPQWRIVKRPARDKTGTVAVGQIETPWGDFNYREVDWPVEKEMAANIAANRVGGEFDLGAVGKLLAELDGKFDLNLTGFTADEAEQLIKDAAADLPEANTPFESFEDGETPVGVVFKFGDYSTRVTDKTYRLFVDYVEKNKKSSDATELMDALLRKLLGGKDARD